MKCIKCKHLESRGRESICIYFKQVMGSRRFDYFEEKYPIQIININNKDNDANIQDELFNKW